MEFLIEMHHNNKTYGSNSIEALLKSLNAFDPSAKINNKVSLKKAFQTDKHLYNEIMWVWSKYIYLH